MWLHTCRQRFSAISIRCADELTVLAAACSDSMISRRSRRRPLIVTRSKSRTQTLVDYVRKHIERKRTDLGEDAHRS